MQLNKVEKLRFIVKGKQKLYKIMFKEMLFNIIPIYYSEDVENLLLLKFKDNSIVVIVNEDYINNNDKTNIIIEILNNILIQKYNSTLVDLHIANWIGYTSTIIFLHNEGFNERIDILEKYIDKNVNNLILNKENILKQFKYVDVK